MLNQKVLKRRRIHRYTFLNSFYQNLGDLKDGLKEGYGKYIFVHGERYEGGWLNNKFDGDGTYFYKDGALYIGQWKNSKK